MKNKGSSVTENIELDAGLPANIDAERVLLGAVLLENQVLGEIISRLEPDDFSLDSHRRIARAMKTLADREEAIDIITLANLLTSEKAIESVGGVAYLAQLTEGLPMRPVIDDYIRIVKDKGLLRKVMLTCSNAIARAADQSETGFEILTDLAGQVEQLAEPGKTAKQGPVKVFIGDVAAQDNEEYLSRRVPCIPTGNAWLDSKMGGGYRMGKYTIVAARPKVGKAQPLDSLVLLRSGEWKRMGDLRVGDALASSDGVSSVVLAIYPQGVLKQFRITFSDGRSTLCSPDHLWRVYSRHWEKYGRVVTTAQIANYLKSKRHQKRLHIDRVSGDFGTEQQLPIDPWLMGFLLGDGNLSRCRFSTGDAELVERVNRVVAPMGLRCKRTGTTCNYAIAGPQKGKGAKNPLLCLLRKLGIVGHRSEDKRIPPQYLKGSREQRMELIRGLMDADGTVAAGGSLQFCSTSPTMVNQFISLIQSVGCAHSVRLKQPKGGLRAYEVGVFHQNRPDFFSLERKKRMARERAAAYRVPRLTIRSIEECGEAEMQCISVSHASQLYITNDYILTHNTGFATASVAWNCKYGRKCVVFSLEMEKSELLHNFIPYVVDLPNRVAVRPDMRTPDQHRLVQEAWETLMDWPLVVHDGDMDIDQVCWTIDRETRQGEEVLFAIDHFGLLGGKGKSAKEIRERYVENSSRLRRKMFQKKNCALINLFQLNPVPREFADKRPLPDDLKESKNPLEDCYACILLHRYIDKESLKITKKANINLAMIRGGGSPGNVDCEFSTRYLRFDADAELELDDDNYIAS